MDERIRRGIKAGTTGAVIGGIPSTVYAAVRRTPLLEATKAAGALALPGEQRSAVLAAAGIPVHLGISVSWGIVLSYFLPRRRTVLWGAIAGATIATAVFNLPWHRAAPVQNLPFAPQLADHIAFGATTALIIRSKRG